MQEAAIAINMALCIWVLFFGGADKIENTVAASLRFGLAGEKAQAIRLLAWIHLAAIVVFVLVHAD